MGAPPNPAIIIDPRIVDSLLIHPLIAVLFFYPPEPHRFRSSIHNRPAFDGGIGEYTVYDTIAVFIKPDIYFVFLYMDLYRAVIDLLLRHIQATCKISFGHLYS